MLGKFLFVGQYFLTGIQSRGVDGSLHWKGEDPAFPDPDKKFGRDYRERSLLPLLGFRMAEREEVLQACVRPDTCFNRKVGEVRIGEGQVSEDLAELFTIRHRRDRKRPQYSRLITPDICRPG